MSQPSQPEPRRPRRFPLDGVRVVDFCWAVAGPVTTKFLALFGAEVIKIESRTRLDGSRLGFPFIEGRPGVNKSGYYANHNPAKLSVRLDLAKPEGREVARRLVRVADVATESFSVGVMERWGLDYPELTKVKQDLIMISLAMQGQTGRYARHVGFGRTLAGLAGIDNLTGWPDGAPAGPNQPYTDLVVPWFAVTSVLAALRHRQRTGRGQHIDLAQLEAAMHFLAPAALDYSVNGRTMTRDGNRAVGAAPHGVYPCEADPASGGTGWCAITVLNDAHWRNLCNAIGQSELASDQRFATLLRRKANEAELDAIVEAWTSARGADEAAETLQRAGVPAAVVATGRDLHQDPQLRHRDHLHVLEHPVMGQRTYSRPSFRMSEASFDHRRASLLGEHNDYVFGEILGMSAEELADLQQQGIFE
ncbi:MAG: CoA transferase [Dehalococcoidia bacterium]